MMAGRARTRLQSGRSRSSLSPTSPDVLRIKSPATLSSPPSTSPTPTGDDSEWEEDEQNNAEEEEQEEQDADGESDNPDLTAPVKPARARNTQRLRDGPCYFVADCQEDVQMRKCVSHYFGRNKRCTRMLPHREWLYACRRHYQRTRYRQASTYPLMQADILRQQVGRFHAWSEANRNSGHGLVITGWTLALQKKEQDMVDRHSSASMVPQWLAARRGRGLTTNDLFEIIERVTHELRERHYEHIPLIEFLPQYDESRAQPGEIPPNTRDKKRVAPKRNQKKRQGLKRAYDARVGASHSPKGEMQDQLDLNPLPYGAQQQTTSHAAYANLANAQGFSPYQQAVPARPPGQFYEQRPIESAVNPSYATQDDRYGHAYLHRRESRGPFYDEQYGSNANGLHLAPLREQHEYHEYSAFPLDTRPQAFRSLSFQGSSNTDIRYLQHTPTSMYASTRDVELRHQQAPHMAPTAPGLARHGMSSGYVVSTHEEAPEYAMSSQGPQELWSGIFLPPDRQPESYVTFQDMLNDGPSEEGAGHCAPDYTSAASSRSTHHSAQSSQYHAGTSSISSHSDSVDQVAGYRQRSYGQPPIISTDVSESNVAAQNLVDISHAQLDSWEADYNQRHLARHEHSNRLDWLGRDPFVMAPSQQRSNNAHLPTLADIVHRRGEVKEEPNSDGDDDQCCQQYETGPFHQK
ncbi:uncharacterized protein J7T54_006512 [Emericellopsis cladophorae]|uniref:Uncharacterized protein n=1 Tax=Emericellopsis cladophorae TaxID=2686198 RepID=A0A9P9Y6P0_9HYPO|nr:uncharacterized protein J7T54_006512 [Emericellopsis cladophorae]KAI6784467.1 hypothetical protein J7T54_006512 [Emericellopsis cladophorae]